MFSLPYIDRYSTLISKYRQYERVDVSQGYKNLFHNSRIDIFKYLPDIGFIKIAHYNSRRTKIWSTILQLSNRIMEKIDVDIS